MIINIKIAGLNIIFHMKDNTVPRIPNVKLNAAPSNVKIPDAANKTRNIINAIFTNDFIINTSCHHYIISKRGVH